MRFFINIENCAKIKNVYFTTYVCYGAKVKEKEEAQFIDSDYIGEYSA